MRKIRVFFPKIRFRKDIKISISGLYFIFEDFALNKNLKFLFANEFQETLEIHIYSHSNYKCASNFLYSYAKS